MENKIEEIMREYKDGIKNIDDKYEVKEVREVREPKIPDTKELDDKIEYEKSFIARLKDEGDNIKDMTEKDEKTGYKAMSNKEMIERAEARLQLAENEKKEIEKNYEEKLAKYNKSIEKREEKVFEKEKMKRSLVVLPSGREVTMAEKDKMDKQELKDVAIRKLTQESKNISEELLKKDEEVKAINKEMIDIDYELRIRTEGDDDKIEKRHQLNQKLLDLRKEMKDLSTIQEKCNNYLKELKEPTLEQKLAAQTYTDLLKEQQAKQENDKQENDKQEKSGMEEQNNDEPKSSTKNQEPIEEKIIDEQQENRENDGKSRFEYNNSKTNDNKVKELPDVKVEISKTAKITIDGNEYKISSKQVKDAINESVYTGTNFINILAEKTKMDSKEYKKLKDVMALNTGIKNIENANPTSKKFADVLEEYKLGKFQTADNTLIMSDHNKDNVKNALNIQFDMSELQKVNIIKRIFRKEVNNNEKDSIAMMAYNYENDFGAVLNGEYNWDGDILKRISNKFKEFGDKILDKFALPENKKVQELEEGNENTNEEEEYYNSTRNEFVENLKKSAENVQNVSNDEKIKNEEENQATKDEDEEEINL